MCMAFFLFCSPLLSCSMWKRQLKLILLIFLQLVSIHRGHVIELMFMGLGVTLLSLGTVVCWLCENSRAYYSLFLDGSLFHVNKAVSQVCKVYVGFFCRVYGQDLKSQ